MEILRSICDSEVYNLNRWHWWSGWQTREKVQLSKHVRTHLPELYGSALWVPFGSIVAMLFVPAKSLFCLAKSQSMISGPTALE